MEQPGDRGVAARREAEGAPVHEHADLGGRSAQSHRAQIFMEVQAEDPIPQGSTEIHQAELSRRAAVTLRELREEWGNLAAEIRRAIKPRRGELQNGPNHVAAAESHG